MSGVDSAPDDLRPRRHKGPVRSGNPTLQTLKTLSIERDAEHLATFPPPEHSVLAKADPDELFGVAKVMCELWVLLVRQPEVIGDAKVELRCPHCNEVTEIVGRELWGRILLSVGAYYDFAVRRMIQMPQSKSQGLPPGLVLAEIQSLIKSAPHTDDIDDFRLAHLISCDYFICLFGVILL